MTRVLPNVGEQFTVNLFRTTESVRKATGVRFSLHDLRATCATGVRRVSGLPQVPALVLGHQGVRELGLAAKKGLLFYGPPGTGKTHTIRYLAGQLRDHTTLLITTSKHSDLHVVMVLPDKAEDAVVGKYIAGEQWFQLSQLWSVPGRSRVRAYVMYKKHPVKPTYVNVYVHAKMSMVDDLWMTIGSANMNNRSMIVDTECNVQVAHRDVVKLARKKAWKEMLGDSAGEAEDAVSAIHMAWIPRGERNTELMKELKELEGYIVPLRLLGPSSALLRS